MGKRSALRHCERTGTMSAGRRRTQRRRRSGGARSRSLFGSLLHHQRRGVSRPGGQVVAPFKELSRFGFSVTAQYWAFHCSPFTTSCRTIEGRGSDAADAIVTPLVCDWLIKNAVVTRAQVLIIVLSSFAVRTSLRPRRQHSLPPCYHNVLRTTWGARFTRTQPTESWVNGRPSGK